MAGPAEQRRSVAAPLLAGAMAAVLTAPLASGGEPAAASTAPADGCSTAASAACFNTLALPGDAGRLHYYASASPDDAARGAVPTTALIAMHGHSRDADKTFEAALAAAQRAGVLAQTLVIAPLFQVAADRAGSCHTAGVPEPQPGDLLWTCGSWAEGDPALNGGRPTSFAALDALVSDLQRRWPSLQTITIAGFSAGGQFVQHYVGFAAPLASRIAVRYVVADPGSWLYFDPQRPQPMRDGQAADWAACSGGPDGLGGCSLTLAAPADATGCPAANRWKYGTDALPPALGADAAQARARYAAADIRYLEGTLDTGAGRGTAYRVLDRSCGALAQGPYRVQRGLAYAAYDRALLAPARQRQVTLVPGCAHDVACVFPAEAARAALFAPH